MTKFVTKFVKNESGATAIEYGLIAAMLCVALIAALTLLGNGIGNTFNGIGSKMP